MNLLCLSGSLRAASSSRAVLDHICSHLPEGVAASRFDIGSLPHYNADLGAPEVVEALKAAIDAADGLVIVTPEYNYSVPGVLKNAIDWASRPAYASVFKDKPVLVAQIGVLGRHRVPHQAAQPGHRGVPLGHVLLRQGGLGTAQRERELVGERDRALDGTGIPREPGAHLTAAAQVRGAGGGQPAVHVVQRGTRPHGREGRREIRVARGRVVSVGGRDER